MSYSIRYNRTTNHIAGIAAKCTSSGEERGGVVVEYAENACGSLTRYALAEGKSFEDLREALDAARITGGRKVCKRCEKAALAAIEAIAAATPVAPEPEQAPVIEVAESATETVEGAEHQVGDTLYFIPSKRPHGYRCPAGEVEVVRVVDHKEATAYAPRFSYVVQVPGIAATSQGTDASELHKIGEVPRDDRFDDTVVRTQCGKCRKPVTYANTKIVTEPIHHDGPVYPGMCTQKQFRVCADC
ncbi:hypothetical protein SEA_DRYAD_100 [Streptomyces phage Dryad]|nr:hypothetical protein SEA_DRYAD_100 [Streptomyces phage Dryad]